MSLDQKSIKIYEKCSCCDNEDPDLPPATKPRCRECKNTEIKVTEITLAELKELLNGNE